MAIFHFFNCSLATFSPFYIIFDGFKLSQNVGIHKLSVIVFFYYIITQIIKLFILAFFSFGLLQNMNIFNIVFQESANIIDLVGIHYILMHKHINTISVHERLLSVGLGWGFFDSVATNFFPYLIGARSLDFSLKYVYRSVAACSFLVSNLAKVCLLFLWIKNRSTQNNNTLIYVLLTFFSFALPLINKIILLKEDSFNNITLIQLSIQLVVVLILSWISMMMFSSYSKSSNEKITKTTYVESEPSSQRASSRDSKRKFKNKKKKI